jgi:Fungal protein kinase
MYTDAKNLILDLVLSLQFLPAARSLRSRNDLNSLSGDLGVFFSHLDSGEVNAKSMAQLLRLVVELADDLDIWNAVYSLVTRSKRTPPTVCNEIFQDTPLRSTSSSQQGSEQTHDEIDDRILQEIDGCVYSNTRGFYKKYFEERSWSSAVEQIARDANPQIINNRWTDYPEVPSQAAFMGWLKTFQEKFFIGMRGRYYTSHSSALSGSDCGRQPDIFLAISRPANSSNKVFGWPDVRVIGELKQSVSRKYQAELVGFCGLAREVFTSQPTRLFLHGFIIRGSIVELWVFDRSGPYAGEKFDLHEDPDRFIKAMAGYAMMSDEELGLDTYVKEDTTGRYIELKPEGMTEEEKLYLEDKPIALQHAIVCRGTTCYRAKRLGLKNWEFVVKFSWRSDQRQAEGELLKLAKDKGVWGVAGLFGYQDLSSIAKLRQGLRFGKPRSFSSAASRSVSQTPSGTKSKNSRSWIPSLGFSKASTLSSGQKRGPDGEAIELRRSKRSKSGSSLKWTGQVTLEQGNDTGGASKHVADEIEEIKAAIAGRNSGLGIDGVCLSSSEQKRKQHDEAPELRRSKRSKSDSSCKQTDPASQVTMEQDIDTGVVRVTVEQDGDTGGAKVTIEQDGDTGGASKRIVDGIEGVTSQVTMEQDGDTGGASKHVIDEIEKVKPTSLVHPRDADDESFDNRIFCCLVVYPPGRAIDEFRSVRELLEALRDAIKGHRSLYRDGKILHRDVSKNNIIIADGENEEDPRGLLIDLDLAKEMNSGPSGARHRTGTMEFMAIEVLEGKAHTYRHDLESFFYVFLWVIIRYGQKAYRNASRASRLRGWYTGTYEEIARNKTGDMNKSQFKKITAEFPPEFEDVKWVAEDLRSLLFPIRDGSHFTGTYSDPRMVNVLYDGMINIFDKAIDDLLEVEKCLGYPSPASISTFS